jgi:hypothetical protein
MSFSELQNAVSQLSLSDQQKLIEFLLAQQVHSNQSTRKMRILGAAESDFQAVNSEAVLQKEWSQE